MQIKESHYKFSRIHFVNGLDFSSQELEPHVLSYGVKCLKAVVTALHPSMYVAIQDASSDTVEYRPKQIDVSR